MAKKLSPDLDQELGGKSTRDWDMLWQPVDGGLVKLSPSLSHTHGLFRLRRNDVAVYVGSGVQLNGRGIHDRLKQLLGNQTTSNKHFAARLIREYASELSLDVLNLGRPGSAALFANTLKNRLVRWHRYRYNQIKTAADYARIFAENGAHTDD